MQRPRFLLKFIVVILLIISPQFLLSQIITSKLKSSKGKRTTTEEPSIEEKISLAEQGYPVPTIQALETIVDPDEYIVGPGDMFYINVWGDAGLEFPTQVTPEGKLVVKTLGAIHVNGNTLAEVQKKVLKAGEKKYRLDKISANLVQLRTFRVHVVGEVENPGTYVAQAVDRVSVLIDRAMGVTEWADERHVEIRHSDGTVDSLDLFNFKKLGHLEQNIYVQNGDLIYVPAIKLSQKTVALEGHVTQPGIHQIIEGETLKNFLLRVNAFTRDLDLHDIYVIRTNEQGSNHKIFLNLLGKKSNPDNAFPDDLVLKDGDRIYMPSLKNKVYVHGAVNIPGGHIYMAGFTARDYVGLAGGTADMGNINGIKVIHFSDNTIDKGPDAPVERGDTIIVPTGFRKKFTEYLQIVASLATLVFAYMAAQR